VSYSSDLRALIHDPVDRVFKFTLGVGGNQVIGKVTDWIRESDGTPMLYVVTVPSPLRRYRLEHFEETGFPDQIEMKEIAIPWVSIVYVELVK
jgi:hypothetical protein